MPTNDFVTTTSSELHDRIDRAHDRFAELIAATSPGLRVGEWTAAQVVGHLVNVVNRYNAFDPARLAADPRGVDAINDRELAPLIDTALDELLEHLDTELGTFRARFGPDRAIPLETPLPFHGGATIDLQSGLTNLIGELLVHGRDVAVAAGTDWPIDDRDAVLLCGLATQIAPAYLAPTERDRLVHVEVAGLAPWALGVLDGRPVSRSPQPEDHPDVVLRGPAEPVALFVDGRLDPSQLEHHAVQVTGEAAALRNLMQAP